MEAVEFVHDRHVEGGGRRAFFLGGMDVKIVVIGPLIGQAMNEIGIAAIGKDHGSVLREKNVEFLVGESILLRSAWGEAAVLGATFLLTIFRDLAEAIVVGFALGSVLFIHRMSRTTALTTHTPFVGRDEADSSRPRGAYDEELAANPDIVICRITGALFFGATASIGSVLDRIQDSLYFRCSRRSFRPRSSAFLPPEEQKKVPKVWVVGGFYNDRG